MDEQRRPAPEVTVRDPARPRQPSDVLVAGPEPDPQAREGSRRAVVAVAGVLALLAAVAVGAELQERRAADREERRLASVVDLALDDEMSASGGFDPTAGTASLEILLRLRNEGPRPVTVLRGAVAGYSFAGELEIRPGAEQLLLLSRTVSCAPPPTGQAATELEVTVAPASGGSPRATRVPFPFDLLDDQASRACGFAPLHEVVTPEVVDLQQRGTTLRVTVRVTARSRQPVRVIGAVTADSGLAAHVEELSAGQVEIPSAEGRIGVATLTVDLTVTDCAAARRGEPEEPLGVALMVEDDLSAQALPPLGLDPSLRAALIAASC